ncbi:tyrosine-type recombinase/integrase [Nocardioides panacis]|uniref:Tyrosine-type recombinase/integrase n=1 Tax=Nocardioides panacis TaxID=2849501 RepID=A0A975T121_9ACTN|nr:tyrosine-type recombinase/integrase [Nocardioides panacis]QWZ09673.1 tyrosine-type recombinase/integrase [Nocardioides panacis]
MPTRLCEGSGTGRFARCGAAISKCSRPPSRRGPGHTRWRPPARQDAPLASYRADDHGQGAARNFAEATHRFFSEAVRDGHLCRSPTDGLGKPPQQHNRRPINAREEANLRAWICLRRRDPILDLLLLDLFIRSGSRREGILQLTVDGIDLVGCAIQVFQKNAKGQRIPVARSVLRRALELGRERGATEGPDRVLRQQHGAPVTRRYLDTLFHTAAAELAYGADGAFVGVSPHWLRHTSTDRIRQATKDPFLSSFWMNHSMSQFGISSPYLTNPSWAELCVAAERAFGRLED